VKDRAEGATARWWGRTKQDLSTVSRLPRVMPGTMLTILVALTQSLSAKRRRRRRQARVGREGGKERENGRTGSPRDDVTLDEHLHGDGALVLPQRARDDRVAAVHVAGSALGELDARKRARRRLDLVLLAARRLLAGLGRRHGVSARRNRLERRLGGERGVPARRRDGQRPVALEVRSLLGAGFAVRRSRRGRVHRSRQRGEDGRAQDRRRDERRRCAGWAHEAARQGVLLAHHGDALGPTAGGPEGVRRSVRAARSTALGSGEGRRQGVRARRREERGERPVRRAHVLLAVGDGAARGVALHVGAAVALDGEAGRGGREVEDRGEGEAGAGTRRRGERRRRRARARRWGPRGSGTTCCAALRGPRVLRRVRERRSGCRRARTCDADAGLALGADASLVRERDARQEVEER